MNDPASSAEPTLPPVGGKVAFVLGGGGLRGAAEIGMAKALADTDIRPDMVFGTSIGAVNGAVLCTGELPDRVAFLEDAWHGLASTGVLREQLWGRVSNMVRHGTHLHAPDGLRRLLHEWIPQRRFDELLIPFECSAACIETSSESWFHSGPLIEPILASCSVPTLLPPAEIDGHHYIDGGVVNSIPISRAIECGATTIYVLHVGNIDTPLQVPRTPWDIAFVSFEISRRHRFHRDMATIPPGIEVHVLPTGRNPKARYNDLAKLRYNHGDSIAVDIERSYRAASDHLAAIS
ncbi:patatin-like phospholipase family protein [Ilumatobacter sp.]|uniref:patatin-like phospholipase family protein n=1 Tax=Ilumatobacter sp. TaxID=1967498 RepID=UPI003AF7F160